jgi:hypothetical protein
VSRRGLVVAVALAALLAPATARADADPASDYLYSLWVFLPYETKVPAGDAAQLRAVVRESRKAGYPIKVAVIGSPSDLGGVSALWKKPGQYARFLGSELTFLYKGRLLVVMPNGFGFSKNGLPVPKEARAFDEVEIGPGGVGLAQGATAAVRALAAANGHPVALPSEHPAGGKDDHSTRDRAIIGVAILVVGLAWAAVLLLRRRRAATGS